jgi:hypothetical protein
MKAPLILVISDRMDSNQKQDRYEDRLIRMGEKARHRLGLRDEKSVELWPEGSAKDRITRSKVLEIFQAYSKDLKNTKKTMPEEEYNRVGFVTSRTFNFICKDKRKKKKDIWIADTVEDTIIGADPEFVLMNDDDSIKYAAEIDGFHHTDILGSDGPWAEIRPEPAIEVSDFVDNIRGILKSHKNVKLIQKYRWMGGCYYQSLRQGDSEREWPIGGHIHIGTPGRLARSIESFGDYYKAAVYACLNKVLDEYVAIPMIKVDGMEDSANRRRSFGFYGDTRTEHGRLEYRMLSGEWLTHPKMAKIVVGTVKAIAHEFFKILDESDYKHAMIMTKKQQSSNNYDDFYFFRDDFCYWKNIEIMRAFGAVENSSSMRAILDKNEIEFNKPFFIALKKKLRNLSIYNDYSEYLDEFVELVGLPNKILLGRDKELKHSWVKNSEFIL